MPVQYAQVDQQQLAIDINAIKETIGKPTFEDFQHLKKVERWGRWFAIFGYLTAWIFPLNILSALLISTANICRWANVAHPVMHGAYDKVPGIPERYTRKKFAKGWRRIVDWLDWIEPKSWDYEHNTMHHYNLGEKSDPDNIEINLRWLRESNIPMWLRYIIVISFASIWKIAYYSPQTLKITANAERAKRGEAQHTSFMRIGAWSPFFGDGFRLWTRCYLPYIGFRFVFMPLLFLPLGANAALNVLMASLLAEVFTNLHSFFIIVPNHSAEDIYRFEESSQGRGEFYLRQIIGTVNYNTGSDRIDFLHGWLNYQIEHHLFPSLPLNYYQKMQPLVKEICEKHNLPYRQDGVFKRAWMTIELMVGKTDQLVIKHA
ncbi:MAG: fatty acid desaturase [Pseudomonadales bacterium]|nr:fatty acid desaturase [Pseudomonadales bacterium]